jgi:HPt (histidine-containing phosphotransfer) domain-containing protein
MMSRKRMRGEDRMTVPGRLAEPAGQQTEIILDEDHLGRMTLGDRSLEREILEIFARQTVLMLGRIVGAEPSHAAAAAHTLKGSARGIGAWRVARAAERLEQAAADGRDLDEAAAALKAAGSEVRATIAARLDDAAGAIFGRHSRGP